MILYHGSDVEIKCPKIITSEKGRDFGFGFYTTTIQKQAERWAARIANLHTRQDSAEHKPIVSVFEFDEDAAKGLNTKFFEGATLDWLELVIKCRSDIHYSHGFDIVFGKIANDNVGETVEFVLAGVMRKEDAVERLKFEKINDQMCFNTEKALQTLRFVKSYTL